MTTKLLRLPQVSERLAKSRSKLYVDQKCGLLPPFVRISARAVALPSTEVDALIAARVAGRSDDEVRHLVKELTAARRAA